jgi:hypothetical protein
MHVIRIAVFLALGFSVSLLAQTINPQIVEFNPSPDHSRTVDGVAVVTRYTLSFYAVGSGVPEQTIDLGKPNPASDGVIRVNFASQLGTWPTDGVTYEARVTANGPGGSTPSTVSNTFVFPSTAPPPCTPSLSSTSQSVGSAASTGIVNVSNGATCNWTAASDASWLTVTGGASGTGDGTVGYSVSANGSASQRTGRITIAGLTFTVTQAGVSCTYSLSALSRNVSSSATTGNVAVTSATGCTWEASSDAPWLAITDGATGSGEDTVSYSVSANPTTSERVGHLTIAGLTFTLTQAGGTCSYQLSQTSRTVGSAATTGSLTVTTGSTCTWSPVSSGSWLTITNGTGTRTGGGTVNYSVAANTATAARSATITANSATFTLTQSGACSFVVSPSSQAFNPSGGNGSVNVSGASGCAWTATRSGSWITILSGSTSGTGNGTVQYRVSANSGSSARAGTLTVAGHPVSITQSAATAPNAPAGLRILTVR